MGMLACCTQCRDGRCPRQLHEHTDTWSITSWCMRPPAAAAAAAAAAPPRVDSSLPLSAMMSPSSVITWCEELVSSSSSRRTSSALLQKERDRSSPVGSNTRKNKPDQMRYSHDHEAEHEKVDAGGDDGQSEQDEDQAQGHVAGVVNERLIVLMKKRGS